MKPKRNEDPTIKTTLVDAYLQHEKDHVPILKGYCRNKEGLEERSVFSNLFNFRMNFKTNRITIEDDTGVFSSGESERTYTYSIDEFLAMIAGRLP